MKTQNFCNIKNNKIKKLCTCFMVLAVFCALSSTFLAGCVKNIDTYKNSIYFKNNQSEKTPSLIAYEKDVETTELTKAVSPAVVAILAQSSVGAEIGSGVCIKSGGYVVTNYHVVEGATTITLYLSDGKTCSAMLLYYDAIMDIAILKSEVAIPYLDVAENNEVSVGRDVIACGTPLSLNFTHTYTKGIVSALDRTIEITTSKGVALMQNLIQHDASINPGNSGGPLINMRGQVVGINTMKITSAEGLGFAIPTDTFISILNNVYENYNYKAPYLGVYGYDASLYSNFNDTAKSHGFYVLSIADGSPAHAVGMQVGDVITKINGQDINNALDFRKQLFKNSAYQTAEIQFERQGVKLVRNAMLQGGGV